MNIYICLNDKKAQFTPNNMDIQKEIIYQTIKEIILQARQRVFRVANSTLLETYWLIGQTIVEDEQNGNLKAEYGKATLKNLARQLTIDFGKGYDESNLRNMRTFYKAFPIRDTLRHELSWSHYRMISRLDTAQKRKYYIHEVLTNNLTIRQLQRSVNTLSYERTIKHSPTKNETPTIQNLIKDPNIFDFLGLPQDIKNTERSVETAIINHLQTFLLEFGKGFAFVARQQHIVTDTHDFFIDLVFYNYLLKCFVILELKADELTHQDIGQLDMYVRMYDDLKRSVDDNPTIGILLCTEKDETIVKYSVLNDHNNLFASKYLLYLPKEEELKQLIERDRIEFELNKEE
jgi:predicted nuclease of restriction endonuclease-like (RecB) superfamily